MAGELMGQSWVGGGKCAGGIPNTISHRASCQHAAQSRLMLDKPTPWAMHHPVKSKPSRKAASKYSPLSSALTQFRSKGGIVVLLALMAALGGYVAQWQQGRKEQPSRSAERTIPKPAATTSAAVTGGKVVGVHDGDTITVYSGTGPQLKVRLLGIDAPELKQAFGNVAKQSLSEMVFGRTVELRGQNKDRYGRTLATVVVEGMDVNLAMVRSGLAWHYKAYSKDSALAGAEQEARTGKRGLWSDAAPVAPWDFRRKKS